MKATIMDRNRSSLTWTFCFLGSGRFVGMGVSRIWALNAECLPGPVAPVVCSESSVRAPRHDASGPAAGELGEGPIKRVRPTW
jgi:hypothetical protein